MDLKCPNCGAAIADDSRFCNYCGAKIDDGVSRVEIRQKIEDSAEMRRASYEEQESLLRQKMMIQKMKADRAKRILSRVFWISLAVLFLVGFCLTVFASGPARSWGMACLLAACVAFTLRVLIAYM